MGQRIIQFTSMRKQVEFYINIHFDSENKKKCNFSVIQKAMYMG